MNCLVIVVSEFPVASVSLESHARGRAFIKNNLVTKALVSSSLSSVLCPTSALRSRLALFQFISGLFLCLRNPPHSDK